MCVHLFCGSWCRGEGNQEETLDGTQSESLSEVGRPVDEKNDSQVQEGDAVSWACEVLLSKEDRDGGNTGDRFGDGMEGKSEV